jgi:hypothetical protein
VKRKHESPQTFIQTTSKRARTTTIVKQEVDEVNETGEVRVTTKRVVRRRTGAASGGAKSAAAKRRQKKVVKIECNLEDGNENEVIEEAQQEKVVIDMNVAKLRSSTRTYARKR